MDQVINQPEFIITYNDSDVTKDFTPLLESIIFKDFLESRAAELELTFEDEQRNFMNDWYPKSTDKVSAQLGYENTALLDCGLFFVYEVVLTGSRSAGDVCSIRAASVNRNSVNKPIRTKHHKSVAIKKIAEDIASELGLTVKGETDGTYSGEQKQKDIAFMEYVARKTGKIFKIEGNDLILYNLDSIKKASHYIEIDLDNVIDYSFSDKSDGKYSKCTCKWYDEKKKTTYIGTATSSNDGGDAVIWQEVDSNSAAQKAASDWLKDIAKQELELELTVVGNVGCRAGMKLRLINAGRFSDDYYIKESEHEISRSGGYTTKILIAK
ncbi:MAG: hypothetical protein N4A72_14735 [Bacteroidales bacterium]|jgi:phage protein D|nr:hypothetical protein [Bacteroidales bacterium]